MKVAGRVRKCREQAGLTMRDLAEAAGVSVGTIHGVEHGKCSPRLVTLERLAVGLKMDLGELLGLNASVYLRPGEANPSGSRQLAGVGEGP